MLVLSHYDFVNLKTHLEKRNRIKIESLMKFFKSILRKDSIFATIFPAEML